VRLAWWNRAKRCAGGLAWAKQTNTAEAGPVATPTRGLPEACYRQMAPLAPRHPAVPAAGVGHAAPVLGTGDLTWRKGSVTSIATMSHVDQAARSTPAVN